MPVGLGFGGGGGSEISSTTGITPVMDVSDFTEMYLTLIVSSVSGTNPTFDLFLQHSADGRIWSVLHDDNKQGVFPRMTGVGTRTIRVTNFAKYIRAKWTIGGTNPLFTVNFETSGRK